MEEDRNGALGVKMLSYLVRGADTRLPKRLQVRKAVVAIT